MQKSFDHRKRRMMSVDKYINYFSISGLVFYPYFISVHLQLEPCRLTLNQLRYSRVPWWFICFTKNLRYYFTAIKKFYY